MAGLNPIGRGRFSVIADTGSPPSGWRVSGDEPISLRSPSVPSSCCQRLEDHPQRTHCGRTQYRRILVPCLLEKARPAGGQAAHAAVGEGDAEAQLALDVLPATDLQ